MYTMNDAYEDVKLFNKVAGNLENVTLDSIDNQIGFCFEELCEAIEAFEEGDMSNFVKEVIDMQVVLNGLIQELVASGVDIEAAMKVVNENNLTKFPKEVSPENHAAANTAGYTTHFNGAYSRWMFKDANGKVKKPADYVPADMSNVTLGSVLV